MRYSFIRNAAVALILIQSCIFSSAIAGTRPSSSDPQDQSKKPIDKTEERKKELGDADYRDQQRQDELRDQRRRDQQRQDQLRDEQREQNRRDQERLDQQRRRDDTAQNQEQCEQKQERTQDENRGQVRPVRNMHPELQIASPR